jgi:hypothetical protein
MAHSREQKLPKELGKSEMARVAVEASAKLT